MDKSKPANEPAKKSKNPAYYLTPFLPGNSNIGSLKDMAQEIIAASAGLEGKVAGETAIVLGDQLRLVNSYYSNLIEGHKTTIPDISKALQKKFSKDPRSKTSISAANSFCLKFMQRSMPTYRKNICTPTPPKGFPRRRSILAKFGMLMSPWMAGRFMGRTIRICRHCSKPLLKAIARINFMVTNV